MNEDFDPYHRWLGVAPEEQPANHYRLLGLRTFESDADVIESAADRQMSHVRSFQAGKHANDAQRILNEIAAAKLVLLKDEEKLAYDTQLKAEIEHGEQKKKKLATATPLQAVTAPPPLTKLESTPDPLQPIITPDDAPKAGLPKEVVFGGVAIVVALLLVGGLVAIVKPWKGEAVVSRDNEVPSTPRTDAETKDDTSDKEVNTKKDAPPPKVVDPKPVVVFPKEDIEPTPPDVIETPDDSPPVVAVTPTPPAGPQKTPVPAKADRDAKRTKIAGIFSLSMAKTPEAKAKLAMSLLATARDTEDDPVALFVLLNLAREVAAEAAQIRLAFTAIDLLEATFEFDLAPIRMMTLGEAVKAPVPVNQKGEVVVVGIEMFDQLMAKDEYDAAAKIATPLLDLARRARDKKFTDMLIERRTRARQLHTAYTIALPAFETLKTDPGDADANFVVGKFYLYGKGQWGRALPMLAKGSDEALAAVAKAEIERPSNTPEEEKLANAWWSIAIEETDKTAQKLLQARALAWYQRAEKGLVGLPKAKVQQRVKQLVEAGVRPGSLAFTAGVVDVKPKVTAPQSFVNSIGIKLVKIPAGEFVMGSPESEADRNKDEQQHRVRLSRPFYLATTEVTQGQWEAVMGTTPWKGRSYAREGADDAASHLTWEEATEYCIRLGKKEGRKYRLPTEAEWEYACRGGSATTYSFGDAITDLENYAWFSANAKNVGRKYAQPVGQKRANRFGLYDMHGNVWEWCSDWYDADYYAKSPSVDPKGPSSGSSRVFRGGSWGNYAKHCRSAHRAKNSPTSRSYYSGGFRVVCELGSPQPNTPVPAIQPIIHYTFDEGRGTIAHDSSGGDHHATLKSTKVLPWAKGIVGSGALQLAGHDQEDFLTAGNLPDLKLGIGSFTLAAWIRCSRGGMHTIFVKGGPGSKHYKNRGFHFYGEEIHLGSNANRSLKKVPVGKDLETGEWLHIAAVRNIDDQKLQLYVDGQLVNEATYGSQDLSNPGLPLLIGGFKGDLDDVRIYDIALAPREIRRLHAMGGVGLSSNPTSIESPHSQPATRADIRLVDTRHLVDTPLIGARGKSQFRSVSPAGGLLVGVKVSTGRHGPGYKARAVASIQGFYLTPNGIVAGKTDGPVKSGVQTLMAKDGYAVGGIKVTMGGLSPRPDGGAVKGVRIVFMRIIGDRLDPKDTYESPDYLAMTADAFLAGGDGKPIVGIHGGWAKQEIRGLGVVQVQ